MQKFMILCIAMLMVISLVACNDDTPGDTSKEPNTEASAKPEESNPPIKVYPDTPEKYMLEKYGEGWVLQNQVEDAMIFVKDNMEVVVYKKKDLVDKYKLSADWFEGHFGDNGYFNVAQEEIIEYFTPDIKTAAANVNVLFVDGGYIAYPYTLSTDTTWEENWKNNKDKISPCIKMYTQEKLTEEQLDAIELALIKHETRLFFTVYWLPEEVMNDADLISSILMDEKEEYILRDKGIFIYD